MSNIPIVYITDDNYVMPTIVSITSLMENMEKSHPVFVLGINLSEKNKDYFKVFKNIELLDLENKYKDLDLKHLYVSKAALFKFDLAEIFKNYDKVLYLDSDILTLRDFSKLLKTDIEKYYAAVVKDISAFLRGDAQKIGLGKNYFNSGMMLLNTKKMRQDNIKEKLIKTRLNSSSKKFMDQDTFNIVFKDCVKFVNPEYNYLVTNSKLTPSTVKHFFKVKKISPAILHLTYLKPWKYEGVSYSKEWMKYYNLSPFKNERLNLEKNTEQFKIYNKTKFGDRWVIDFFKVRFSYKKGGKDFRFFYP